MLDCSRVTVVPSVELTNLPDLVRTRLPGVKLLALPDENPNSVTAEFKISKICYKILEQQFPQSPYKLLFPAHPDPRIGRRQARQALGISQDRPVIVACSPSRMETMTLLRAYQKLALVPSPLLVLAVRDATTSSDAQLSESRINHRIADTDQQLQQCGDDIHVLTVVVQGKVPSLLAAADLAIVGEDRNLLEPAEFGVPICCWGQRWWNNRTAWRVLSDTGGAIQVDESILAKQIEDILIAPSSLQIAGAAALEQINLRVVPAGALTGSLAIMALTSRPKRRACGNRCEIAHIPTPPRNLERLKDWMAAYLTDITLHSEEVLQAICQFRSSIALWQGRLFACQRKELGQLLRDSAAQMRSRRFVRLGMRLDELAADVNRMDGRQTIQLWGGNVREIAWRYVTGKHWRAMAADIDGTITTNVSNPAEKAAAFRQSVCQAIKSCDDHGIPVMLTTSRAAAICTLQNSIRTQLPSVAILSAWHGAFGVEVNSGRVLWDYRTNAATRRDSLSLLAKTLRNDYCIDFTVDSGYRIQIGKGDWRAKTLAQELSLSLHRLGFSVAHDSAGLTIRNIDMPVTHEADEIAIENAEVVYEVVKQTAAAVVSGAHLLLELREGYWIEPTSPNDLPLECLKALRLGLLNAGFQSQAVDGATFAYLDFQLSKKVSLDGFIAYLRRDRDRSLSHNEILCIGDSFDDSEMLESGVFVGTESILTTHIWPRHMVPLGGGVEGFLFATTALLGSCSNCP
jgi:hypothetical protein